MKPSQIVSLTSYPGAANTVAAPGHSDSIRVEFAPLEVGPRGRRLAARAAGAFSSAITPGQWIQLIARLGEIPDPKVGSGPRRRRSPIDPGAAPRTGACSRCSAAEGKETGGNR